ncbi:hypothetical protein DV515_00014531, partial [Chloebia gouldiae]
MTLSVLDFLSSGFSHGNKKVFPPPDEMISQRGAGACSGTTILPRPNTARSAGDRLTPSHLDPPGRRMASGCGTAAPRRGVLQIQRVPVAIRDALTPSPREGPLPPSSQAAARFAPLLASRKHEIIGNGSK